MLGPLHGSIYYSGTLGYTVAISPLCEGLLLATNGIYHGAGGVCWQVYNSAQAATQTPGPQEELLAEQAAEPAATAAALEPVTEEPAAEEPVAEEPVAEAAAVETPPAEVPTTAEKEGFSAEPAEATSEVTSNETEPLAAADTQAAVPPPEVLDSAPVAPGATWLKVYIVSGSSFSLLYVCAIIDIRNSTI